jgi:hypothetical protein
MARSKNIPSALVVSLTLTALMAVAMFAFWSRRPALGAATGTVTLDGKPLENAVIVFVPLPPTVSKQSGAEIRGGEFAIDPEVGLAAGEYRVEVHANISPFGADGKPIDSSTLKKLTASLPNIPRRYRSGNTLKVIAKAESNYFDFQLFSKPEGTSLTSSP